MFMMWFLKVYQFIRRYFFRYLETYHVDIVLVVTLNEIHRYIYNFMPYKMIYFLSHKLVFANLFYEHFRQLCEKYAFKLSIKYIMIICSLGVG